VLIENKFGSSELNTICAPTKQITMKQYTVTVLCQAMNGETPLDAAKTFAKWLQEGANEMTFDVLDEESKEAFTVDLAEEDEDAVLPNKE